MFVFGPIIESRIYVTDFFHKLELLVTPKEDLEKKLIEKEEEIKRIRASSFYVEELERENNELKAVFERNENTTALLSRVTLKPNFSPYDNLVVDLGSDDNVQIGDLAMTPSGVYIGDVKEVFDHQSRVEIFSSSGRELVARINEQDIKMYGRGGGNFIANVPNDFTVRKGDLVEIAYYDNSLISYVEDIEGIEAEAEKKLMMKMPVSIYDLEWILIVKK